MGVEENERSLNLNQIWRIIRKIQSGILRYNINLWEYFLPYDPRRTGLISESRYDNCLSKLKHIIGLSGSEIKDVTDYFRQRCGRIAYEQFCDVTCEKGQNLSKNEDLATGLEWDDPMHVNVLSKSEERRLCVLLTKIAQAARLKDIVLMPYFQDYELVARNVGTVTVAHFSRVLHFVNILLSEDDFLLLLKKFMKNSYTVNYVAFVKRIEEIVKYLDRHRMMDISHDIIENFPGRLIDAELPKLPRPEIGKIDVNEIFGIQSSFHPAFQKKPADRKVKEIILRIQRHVHENRIRIHDIFQSFDFYKTGFISKHQFQRSLDNIGVSRLDRLNLSPNDIETLSAKYEKYGEESRVNWRQFVIDIDTVFTEIELEKKPFEIIVSPPENIVEMPRIGQENWQTVKPTIRNKCEEALHTIHRKIKNRNIYLQQFFKDSDRLNLGHVSKAQTRKILYSNGIHLSGEEFFALEKRYSNDLGFNYAWFLEEADPVEYALPKFINKPKKMQMIGAGKVCLPIPEPTKQDIINAVACVKRQAVTKRIRIVDFLKDYDHHREEFISEVNFRRGLDNANIKLSNEELNIVCELFKAPLRKGCIQYKQFCKVIEEAFVQSDLERAPLIVPLQHFPCIEYKGFLNFDERRIISKALQKLAKQSDQLSNISSIFADYDYQNCGSIPRNLFLRALSIRNLLRNISNTEFEVICKCFGVERGFTVEVDYRAFLNILNILYTNSHQYPY